MTIKKFIAWALIIIINAVPVVIWFFMRPFSTRVVNLITVFTSLGQVTALLGMTLFATTLILSTRSHLIERYFIGLSNVYLKHHFFGSVSFVLLLIHPIFLTIKYFFISTSSALRFWLPGLTAWPVSLGIFSLLIMIVLLMMTYRFSLKYHVWKMSHKILGLVFIIALGHLLFISSDVSRNLFLRYYLIGFSTVGLLAYFYRIVLDSFFIKKYRYQVVSVKRLTDLVTELSLRPLIQKMSYRAGQFAFFSFINSALPTESHPFSFVSAPDEETVRIAIKNLGDYTSQINLIKPGDQVEIEGPFGSFGDRCFEVSKQIWIAGGVGITPFISMAKALVRTTQKVDFYISCKDRSEALYLDELSDLARRAPTIKIITCYTNETGYVNVDYIDKTSQGIVDKEIFLCGPVPMMESLIVGFEKKQVKKSRIHFEKFGL